MAVQAKAMVEALIKVMVTPDKRELFEKYLNESLKQNVDFIQEKSGVHIELP